MISLPSFFGFPPGPGGQNFAPRPLIAFDVYTTAGNGIWLPKNGCGAIIVELIGAGGGGGGCDASDGSTTAGGAGGGGGGGYCKRYIQGPLPQSISFYVGTGGTGAPTGANNGTNGEATCFGGYCSASGGAGGIGIACGIAVTMALGGVGGVGSGGNTNGNGQQGQPGMILGSSDGGVSFHGAGGQGGSSVFGGGAPSPAAGGGASGTGVNGTIYGGGGSGAGTSPSNGAVAFAGGNGANGGVVIWSFAQV